MSHYGGRLPRRMKRIISMYLEARREQQNCREAEKPEGEEEVRDEPETGQSRRQRCWRSRLQKQQHQRRREDQSGGCEPQAGQKWK